MKTKAALPDCNDSSLCWTMRLIGIFLVVGSIFFLFKDLSLSQMDNVFFSGTTLLGLLTFGGSWTSARKRTMSLIEKRKTARKTDKMKAPAYSHA